MKWRSELGKCMEHVVHKNAPSCHLSAALIIILMAICATPTKAAITRVSAGINQDKMYEVYRSDNLLTWTDANKFAHEILTTNLVAIRSPSENSFLSTLIVDPSLWVDSNSPPGNYIGPYIGLVQAPGSAEPSGGWQWSKDQSAIGYSNWFSNQPDNYNNDNVGVFYNAFSRASSNTTPAVSSGSSAGLAAFHRPTAPVCRRSIAASGAQRARLVVEGSGRATDYALVQSMASPGSGDVHVGSSAFRASTAAGSGGCSSVGV